MDVKRIIRGPWFWIVVAVVGVLVALQFLAPNGGYDEVDTGEIVEYIKDGQVEEITFIDGDQEIRATLNVENDRKVTSQWVLGQQEPIIALAQEQLEADNIKSLDSENPQPSLLGQLLVSIIPFVIIILLFLFLMNQVQGGGGRVMQFAKSKAKLISKDMPKTTFADVAGAQEAI